MAELATQIQAVADWITLHITMWVLIGVGVYLSIATRAVQVRFFTKMVKAVASSRLGASGGISSFQAFTISLAARVGVGNVFGVAAALLMGGPGAIFWMWVVACVGMATAFFEATLAQIFKVRANDGTFRGGPAYYMRYGLKSRLFGSIFAIITIITCGFVITMVQSNAIADTLVGQEVASRPVTAALITFFAAIVIFGGIRSVARVTEIMAPVMSVIYLIMVIIIVALNYEKIPGIFATIFTSAFSPQPLVGGLGGGILAAIINGTKRGLFSNEAGQGTAPNAAATATVAHPVQQGMIQSLGVFVDTMLVCTATGLVILIAGEKVWNATGVNPGTLTTLAVRSELGAWTNVPMALMIFVLAFSSIIAAYVYSEINMDFVTSHRAGKWAVRIVSVASVAIGAMARLDIVWNTVDIAMAIMTVTNLIALVLLSRWGIGALRDYEKQIRAGIAEPKFYAQANPNLPGDLPGNIWVKPAKEDQNSLENK